MKRILFFFVLLSGFSLNNSYAAHASTKQRIIKINLQQTVQLTPDKTDILSTLSFVGKTPSEAIAGLEKLQKKMIANFKESGLNQHNLTFSSLKLQKKNGYSKSSLAKKLGVYSSWGKNNYIHLGYEAQKSIIFCIEKGQFLGKALNTLAKSGITTLRLEHKSSILEKKKRELRRLAFAKLLKKAKTTALFLQDKIGKVLEVTDGISVSQNHHRAVYSRVILKPAIGAILVTCTIQATFLLAD